MENSRYLTDPDGYDYRDPQGCRDLVLIGLIILGVCVAIFFNA